MVPLRGPFTKDNYLPIVLREGFLELRRWVLWRGHTVAWSRGVSARRGGRIAGRYRPRVARSAAPTWVRCCWIWSVAIGWVFGLDAGHGVPWVWAHGCIPWNRHTDGVCGHYSVLFFLSWRVRALRIMIELTFPLSWDITSAWRYGTLQKHSCENLQSYRMIKWFLCLSKHYAIKTCGVDVHLYAF